MMGWIIGLPEDKLARWFYFYNHDPIGWFSTPTWWLWKSVFGCNGCKKPTRAFGGWFFTPAWWLEISALFHHGFKKPPRAQGGSFFHFSLVRKMGIFLNRLVKPFWKYIVLHLQLLGVRRRQTPCPPAFWVPDWTSGEWRPVGPWCPRTQEG